MASHHCIRCSHRAWPLRHCPAHGPWSFCLAGQKGRCIACICSPPWVSDTSMVNTALYADTHAWLLRVVAPSIMRLNYLSSALASPDPSLDGVLAVVCTQIEICYAIIATTTPCLRPFMSALNTGYGGPGPVPTPKGSRASSSGHDRSFTARSGQSAKQKKQQRFSGLGTFELEEKAQRPLPELRWDKTQYNVAIETGERPRTGQEIEPMPDHDQNSLQSHDSKRMIIAKNTEWAIDYEDQFRQS